MAVKVTLPNVKQNLSNPNGQCSKAWFDFFRLLYERTGGDQDIISEGDDDLAITDSLLYGRRIQDLEKRIKDLENQLDQLGC